MRPNLCVLEYFHHILANPVAPPTDVTPICLVHYKIHLVIKQTAKTASKSMHNWRRYYRCTTKIHPVYNCWKKDFGKFTSCRTFGALKLVHSEPFLDYLYELWHCCLRYIATWGKKFHIGAHLHSGPKLYTAFEFSLNLSAIYTKSCAQTFAPIFRLFNIFDRNFAKLVAPSSNNNKDYLVHLKAQSMLKKRCKSIKIDP